ncbi:MAG: xanthine dehydrogenase family protein molybdopterin-binding subunit [Christensenellales bacterium]
MHTAIGKSIHRRDAWDKVTGRAIYTGDLPVTGVLCARLLTSPHAHARIKNITTSDALRIEGVQAVITGSDCPVLFGALIQDRPALATGRVRYAGEPVAMVVALDEPAAELAVRSIHVDYEPLPFVLTPSEALSAGAPLLHEQVSGYKKVHTDVYPESGTNIASSYRIRKGDLSAGFARSTVEVRQHFRLPPSDHMAMEVRTARAEIGADGLVKITTSSQAPYAVREQLAEAFQIPAGQLRVHVPFVGGGFGGKASVMPEILAYIASRHVNGQAVRLTITREEDMKTAPCRIGLEADIRLGATGDGLLQAAELAYDLDCGAYADIAPYMAKATAVDGSGPYHIDNLHCDVRCVYTNHTYATSYRSFAHESYTFCIERALDMLARKCGIDPLALRLKNAIKPGSLTPSKVLCTPGVIGSLPQCLEKLKTLAEWDGAVPAAVNQDTVRVKGVSCLWKTETPPTDAISGALLTFNPDGSINLNTGVVEIGSGDQTRLAQILAEKLKMDVNLVHVALPVDTMLCPEHWKTVASLTEYMAGNAVLRAADDVIEQLRRNGAEAFGCNPEDIEVGYGRVFKRNNPSSYIAWKDIVQGYKDASNKSIGEPVLGRGGFMLKGLSLLDTDTGEGKTGPAWTVGAQAVEVEVNTKTYTYRILTASTVMDVGMLINPEAMRAEIAGGMAMGISLSSREALIWDKDGIPQTPTLRTYKLLHSGQEPECRVDFVETPEDGSPYGIRCFTEHGIIGVPAALGNALSSALGIEITELPLIPENLWQAMVAKHDTV